MLVGEDKTSEVLDSQIGAYAFLLQEFKGLYDKANLNNEQRVLFMIKLAHVLFFARIEHKVLADRMTATNKDGTIEHAQKIEELYNELTDFLVINAILIYTYHRYSLDRFSLSLDPALLTLGGSWKPSNQNSPPHLKTTEKSPNPRTSRNKAF